MRTSLEHTASATVTKRTMVWPGGGFGGNHHPPPSKFQGNFKQTLEVMAELFDESEGLRRVCVNDYSGSLPPPSQLPRNFLEL